MRSRLFPVFIALAVFVVAVVVGRFLILPMLPGNGGATVQRAAMPADGKVATSQQALSPLAMSTTLTSGANMTDYDQCMKVALLRRMDPIQARHTCAVIADSL